MKPSPEAQRLAVVIREALQAARLDGPYKTTNHPNNLGVRCELALAEQLVKLGVKAPEKEQEEGVSIN